MGSSILFCRPVLFFAVALLATNGQPVLRAQNELPPHKQDSGQQGALLSRPVRRGCALHEHFT